MACTRLSTTVDAHLLAGARRARPGITDAALIDAALEALLARNHAFEMDASYAAYDYHPFDEPDAWATWRHFARSHPPRSRREPVPSITGAGLARAWLLYDPTPSLADRLDSRPGDQAAREV